MRSVGALDKLAEQVRPLQRDSDRSRHTRDAMPTPATRTRTNIFAAAPHRPRTVRAACDVTQVTLTQCSCCRCVCQCERRADDAGDRTSSGHSLTTDQPSTSAALQQLCGALRGRRAISAQHNRPMQRVSSSFVEHRSHDEDENEKRQPRNRLCVRKKRTKPRSDTNMASTTYKILAE